MPGMLTDLDIVRIGSVVGVNAMLCSSTNCLATKVIFAPVSTTAKIFIPLAITGYGLSFTALCPGIPEVVKPNSRTPDPLAPSLLLLFPDGSRAGFLLSRVNWFLWPELCIVCDAFLSPFALARLLARGSVVEWPYLRLNRP